jgi:hypothetical protein
MVVCALAIVATSDAAAAIMNSFFIWFLLKPHQRGCGKNCFLRNMFRRTASFRCEVPLKAKVRSALSRSKRQGRLSPNKKTAPEGAA